MEEPHSQNLSTEPSYRTFLTQWYVRREFHQIQLYSEYTSLKSTTCYTQVTIKYNSTENVFIFIPTTSVTSNEGVEMVREKLLCFKREKSNQPMAPFFSDRNLYRFNEAFG